ncbi:MAG: lysostaphin resistance A-like protein [Planctomycetota bacterium]
MFLLAQQPPPTDPAAATAGGDIVPLPLLVIMTIGFVLGLRWLIRRIATPGTLQLADSPPRLNDLHPVIALGLYLLFAVLVQMSHATVNALWGDNDQLMAVLPGALAFLLFLPPCLIVAHVLFRGGLLDGLGLNVRHWRSDVVRGVGCTLVALPACVAAGWLTAWIISALLPPDQAKELIIPHDLLVAMPTLSLTWKTLGVIIALVLAPVVEEVFFRGIVQSSLRGLGLHPWLGMLITAAFFAVVHLGQPAHWPALFILAIALGYNYERTGRLLPAIIGHAAFNATFTVLTLVSSSGP